MHKQIIRVVILVGLMLMGFTAMAQKDTINNKIDSLVYDDFSYDVYYGHRSYFQNFYNQLNTTKNIQFNKPIQTIGFGTSGRIIDDKNGNFYGHLIFNQVIPQSIIINNNINCKITGFVFSAAFGGGPTYKKFSTYFYFGFNTGRLRMYGNELVRQKNAFFSPKIGLQPKIKFGKLALSLIFEYEYDVTNPNWKRTDFSNNNKINLTSFRQTGITAQLGVGYNLY
jgi:hypothetical protein